MIVALGAGHIGAEEDCEGVRQIVQQHAGVAQQIAGGTIVPHLAIGRQHVVGDLVVGPVIGDLLLQPLDVGQRALHRLIGIIHHAEHVGEVVVKMRGIALGIEQPVDQFVALLGGGAGEEGLGLSVARDAAHDAKIRPTHELLVRGRWVGFDGLRSEHLRHQLVHLPALCWRFKGSRRAGQRLLLSVQIGERELEDRAIARLQKDLLSLDADKGRFDLAALGVRPHASEGASCEGTAAEDSQSQKQKRFHGQGVDHTRRERVKPYNVGSRC